MIWEHDSLEIVSTVFPSSFYFQQVFQSIISQKHQANGFHFYYKTLEKMENSLVYFGYQMLIYFFLFVCIIYIIVSVALVSSVAMELEVQFSQQAFLPGAF